MRLLSLSLSFCRLIGLRCGGRWHWTRGRQREHGGTNLCGEARCTSWRRALWRCFACDGTLVPQAALERNFLLYGSQSLLKICLLALWAHVLPPCSSSTNE